MLRYSKSILGTSGWILTPGSYAGIEEEEEDMEVFEEKMQRLSEELVKQMEESKKLDEEIKENLESIGFKIWGWIKKSLSFYWNNAKD